jgi:hypothetical protein
MRQPSGCGFARRNRASGATRASTASPAASERIQNARGAATLTSSSPFDLSGRVRRVGAGAEWRRQAVSRGRSRRRWQRGKADGVATGACDRGDPGEWSCSDGESPETAVSARTQPSPTAANGREPELKREHRSGESARSRYPPPASAGIYFCLRTVVKIKKAGLARPR